MPKLEEAEAKEVKVALSPAVIEGEGDFAGLTGAVPGLFPVPTQKRSRDEMKKGGNGGGRRLNNLRVDLQRAVFRRCAAVADERSVHRRRLGQLQHASSFDVRQRAGHPTPNRGSPQLPAELQPAWYSSAWATVRTYLHPVRPSVAFNLIDGLIRMTFFLIMIFSFSLLKDIRRVFQYHGAEHKTVFTWEAGLPLTVENARPQPRQHPRCGTSFLMVVMLVAIVLFSVIKFDSLLLNF